MSDVIYKHKVVVNFIAERAAMAVFTTCDSLSIKDGFLMLLDNNDNILSAFAPGCWQSVIHQPEVQT